MLAGDRQDDMVMELITDNPLCMCIDLSTIVP